MVKHLFFSATLLAVLFTSVSSTVRAQEGTKFTTCAAGHCSNGIVLKSDLQRSAGVVVRSADRSGNITVQSFVLRVVVNGATQLRPNKSSMYSKKCKELISMLKPGDMMSIEKVTFFDPENPGVLLDAPNLQLTIK